MPSMTMEAMGVPDWIALVANVFTAAGVLVAACTYRRAKKQDEEERAITAYTVANERYLEYLRMCLENREADPFDVLKDETEDDGEYRRLVIYAVLITAMETAHVRYRLTAKKTRHEQWTGWDEYIKEWVKYQPFRDAWDQLGTQYDKPFNNYMAQLFKDIPADPPPGAEQKVAS